MLLTERESLGSSAEAIIILINWDSSQTREEPLDHTEGVGEIPLPLTAVMLQGYLEGRLVGWTALDSIAMLYDCTIRLL